MHYSAVRNCVSNMQVAHVFHHSLEEEVHAYYEWHEGEYIRLLSELEEISSCQEEWDARYHPSIGRPHSGVTQYY